MGNEITVAPKKLPFSQAIQTDVYQKLINNTLGDENRAKRFVASITSAVATNETLRQCETSTILSAALLGEALDLSPSPQLGFFYMLPFDNNKKGIKEAQFCLGYKGYIQLALRSGYYKKLNVLAIKHGELKKWDPLTETLEVELIEDDMERENAETIGYYAMFEYLNGFTKAIYWSKPKMLNHAKKYSKGFAAKKGYTFWEKDFDGMAYKTMLRQLISKWGIMSTEMQEAFEKDMATLKADGTYEYSDNVEEAEVVKVIEQDEVKEGEVVKEGQVNLDEI